METLVKLKPISEMTDDELDDTDFGPYFEQAAKEGRLERGKYYEWATGNPRPTLLPSDLRERFVGDAEVEAALRRLLELEPDFGR